MSGLILAMKTVTEQLSSVGDDGYIQSNQAQALGKKGNQRGTQTKSCGQSCIATLVHLHHIYLSLKPGLVQLQEFYVDPITQKMQNFHP